MFLLKRLVHFCSFNTYTTVQYVIFNSLVVYWYKNGKMRTQKKATGYLILFESSCDQCYLWGVEPWELPLPGANTAIANNFYKGIGGNSTFLILHIIVLLLVGTTKASALPPLSCLFWPPGFTWQKTAAASCYLCEALNHDCFLTHLSITLSVKKSSSKYYQLNSLLWSFSCGLWHLEYLWQ